MTSPADLSRVSRTTSAVLAALLLPFTSPAQTYTWTAGGNTLTWSNSANWQGGVAPPLSGAGIVQFGSAFNLNPLLAAPGSAIDTFTYTIGGLAFSANAAAFTFTGTAGGLYLGASGIVSQAATTQRFYTSAPSLQLTAAQTWSTSAGGLVLDNSVINNGHTLTLDTASGSTIAFNVNFVGTGGLIKNGAGTASLALSGLHTGDTTLNAGTLALGHADALIGSTLVLNGGSVSFGSLTHVTLGGLSGSAHLTSVNNSGQAVALTVGGNHATTTYSGVLGGAGSLTKNGNGTLTLSGANTFSGSATVASGTLALAHTRALQNSTVALDGGALSFVGITQASLGALEGSGPLALGNTTAQPIALTVGASHASTTYAGAFSGAGSMTKTGNGTLTLSGANAHTGGTTLAGGTLTVASGAALGHATGALTLTSGTLRLDNAAQTVSRLAGAAGTGIVLASGHTFTLAQGEDTTFAGTFSGAGAVVKSGAGALTLSGANTFSGGLTVAGGTLQLGDTGSALSDTGAVTVNGGTLKMGAAHETIGSLAGTGGVVDLFHGTGRTLTVGGNHLSTSYAGVIQGDGGSLVKTGAGTLTLSGANTFSGTTTVNAGTLALAHGSALQASTLALAGGAVGFGSLTSVSLGGLSGHGPLALVNQASQPVALTVGGNHASTSYTGTLSGSGSLVKTGSGTLVLSGPAGFTGSLTVQSGGLHLGGITLTSSATLTGGSLFLQDAGALQSATLHYQGGVVALGVSNFSLRGLTGTGTLDLTNGNSPSGLPALLTLTTDNASTFHGTLSGAGGFEKFGSAAFTLAGANTFSGPTTIWQGTLVIAHADALQNSQLVLRPAGQVNITANGARLAGLAGHGMVNLGAGTLTVGGDHTDTTFSGLLMGSGSLVKTGDGTLTLAGASNHSGTTRIEAGALSVSSDSHLGAIPGSAVASKLILDGGTLRSTASFTLNSNRGLSLAAGGGTLDISTGTLTYAGAIAGSGALIKTGAGSLALNGASDFAGGTTLASGTLAIGHDAALGTGALTLAGGTLQATGSGRTLANAISLTADTTLGGAHALTLTGDVTLARTRDLIVTNSALTTLAGNIGESGGGRGLNKYGAGMLELTGANTYRGGTFIAEGVVRINNTTGSAFGSGAVTVAEGATLTGAGSFTGALQLNGIFSPGNSPGVTATGSETWAGGATLIWEVNDTAGLAGTNWDRIDISGHLAIDATDANPFTIELTSLDFLNASAFAANFDAAADYSFLFLTTTGGIDGFDTSAIFLDLASFLNPFGGQWSIASDGFNLSLHYAGAAGSPIPEPSTYAMLLGAAALALAAHRKRRAR